MPVQLTSSGGQAETEDGQAETEDGQAETEVGRQRQRRAGRDRGWAGRDRGGQAETEDGQAETVLRNRDVYPGSEFSSSRTPNYFHPGSVSNNLSILTQKIISKLSEM
jgi:hypothetical protein